MEATVPNHTPLSGAWRMDEVLQDFPSAQQVLSEKYGIDRLGGPHDTGYRPADTLAAVLMSRGVDLTDAIEHIETGQVRAKDLEITVREAADLARTDEITLLDVREPPAFAAAHIPGSRRIDEALAQEIVRSWPKDAPIVLVCHHGMRSLDAAHYLRGHGFANAKSLLGGVDAWALEIDPSVPRY